MRHASRAAGFSALARLSHALLHERNQSLPSTPSVAVDQASSTSGPPGKTHRTLPPEASAPQCRLPSRLGSCSVSITKSDQPSITVSDLPAWHAVTMGDGLDELLYEGFKQDEREAFSARLREVLKEFNPEIDPDTKRGLKALLGVSETMAWYYLNAQKMPTPQRVKYWCAKRWPRINPAWLYWGPDSGEKYVTPKRQQDVLDVSGVDDRGRELIEEMRNRLRS